METVKKRLNSLKATVIAEQTKNLDLESRNESFRSVFVTMEAKKALEQNLRVSKI